MEVIKVPVSMDDAAAKRQIADLPWCLMIEILSRLPIRTLLMCRCVCKSWLLLFSDPFFVKLQLAKSPPCILRQTNPSETIRKEFDFVWFVDEEEEGIDIGFRIETAVIDFPVRPTYFLNSCNGLLCIETPNEIWVGNPILREWITIQPRPYPDDIYRPPSYAFGFSPKSNQYKLLCLQPLGVNQYATTIYTLGTGQWRSVEGMSPLEGRFEGFFRTWLSTFMNGSLHWISSLDSFSTLPFISYFDFESERFGTLPLPPHPNGFTDIVEISVLNGVLSASVDDNTQFVKIWGMKEYGVEKSWTMMHAIAYREPSVLGVPQLVFPYNAEDISIYEDNLRVLLNALDISICDDKLRVLLSLNEDEVLMVCGFSCSSSRFVSFNTKTRRCRIPKRPQYGTSLTAYTPSFVSLHDVAMEECMVVQSCSAGRKKMLENEANRTTSKSTGLPRKRFYRARAHSNPLSDSHFPVPVSPSHVDYSVHYPAFFTPSDKADSAKKIEFADVGCGFGGLLISLATIFPETLMIGMELRDKVTEHVKERILARRLANGDKYQNVSVVRANSMKDIPNYFEKGQLSKMFFLFPDPHFKEKNHGRRVISPHLLDEYAYVLRIGGIIYTITDVEELGEWMKACLEDHPMFESLTNEEVEADPVVKLLTTATEKGKKVARNEGHTFQAVYRRITQAV